jgi:hypothetical protein
MVANGGHARRWGAYTASGVMRADLFGAGRALVSTKHPATQTSALFVN